MSGLGERIYSAFSTDADFDYTYTDTLRRTLLGYFPLSEYAARGIDSYDSAFEIRFVYNSIDFTMWTTMSESRGIIYSRTGQKPDEGQLIELRQLSKENWYYYVHNIKKMDENWYYATTKP